MKERMPCISGWAEFAHAGCLVSYGPNLRDGYHRLAHYADRILKGAHPSSLPVEQPARVELVVNLKTARALGVTIANSLLLRADEVIQ
jgi:putative ABC transport system substrate-binding protein